MVARLCFLFLSALCAQTAAAQTQSIARLWNELLLDAIRVDFARPTVHARNLFHSSIGMYDLWAALEPRAGTYLLGSPECPFAGFPLPENPRAARNEAISFAMYRLLGARFAASPGADRTLPTLDAFMDQSGYDRSFLDQDYSSGRPAALGNYMADCLIRFGLEDGAHEQDGYRALYYRPVNQPLRPDRPGSPELTDPDRWQPLTLEVFIDQGNNTLDTNTPGFLGPEWGSVRPFALTDADRSVFQRDGHDWLVYHDPGPPPSLFDPPIGPGFNAYQWGFALVALWSSHLDPADGVLIDISPGSVGGIQYFPRTVEEYLDFYDRLEGGDPGLGHPVNPRTGRPYEPQWVPRGDYARVLAEFWADGPDSETPPGHWFTVLNYVNDHPLFEKRFRGQGPVLDDLEWDVKAYFALGGAVHDAAVTAWGIKGWYDYIRPISAIRTMAARGQSSDPVLPRYHPQGMPLVPGHIELVGAGDPLAGSVGQHVGKIKLRAWKGPDFIQDPDVDEAGVGWILAENWWPYQRPSFVTPPFAGYISGHSTFSRAAAEVMTLLTGDEYFPGGLGEFVAPRNQFLVFEEGPSQDVVLQWATYQDASDQTSLSRIWGGIHPPADDIPGRILGERIGKRAFAHAEEYFSGHLAAGIETSPETPLALRVYPNPVRTGSLVTVLGASGTLELFNGLGQRVLQLPASGLHRIDTAGMASGLYYVRSGGQTVSLVVVR